jgi:hypothetical protein
LDKLPVCQFHLPNCNLAQGIHQQLLKIEVLLQKTVFHKLKW